MSDDYTPREMRLMAERDAALSRAEVAEGKLRTPLTLASLCACGHDRREHEVGLAGDTPCEWCDCKTFTTARTT